MEGIGIFYDVKIYGSFIIFSVKNWLEFRCYVLEGIKYCCKFIVGVKYMVGFVQEIFEEEKEEMGLLKKMVIIFLGMDFEVFQLGGFISER